MKFMVIFSIKPETKSRDAAIERFKKTGGMPPKGAKFGGRWTAADFSGGYVVIESDDSKAITEYSLMWTDLIEIKVVPVVDDTELNEVLARKYK